VQTETTELQNKVYSQTNVSSSLPLAWAEGWELVSQSAKGCQLRAPGRTEPKLLPASPIGRDTGKLSKKKKGRRWAGKKTSEGVRSEERTLREGPRSLREPSIRVQLLLPTSVPITFPASDPFTRASQHRPFPPPSVFTSPQSSCAMFGDERGTAAILQFLESTEVGLREQTGRVAEVVSDGVDRT
jgi:hypothetical protein